MHVCLPHAANFRASRTNEFLGLHFDPFPPFRPFPLSSPTACLSTPESRQCWVTTHPAHLRNRGRQSLITQRVRACSSGWRRGTTMGPDFSPLAPFLLHLSLLSLRLTSPISRGLLWARCPASLSCTPLSYVPNERSREIYNLTINCDNNRKKIYTMYHNFFKFY